MSSTDSTREQAAMGGKHRKGTSRPAAPERRCIVTGQTAQAHQMIRFVTSPDGDIVPDVLEKLPGRGMWLTATKQALEEATEKHFSRAARQKVRVPDNLAETVRKLLVEQALSLISLANRAGEAVAGFEKCAGCLRSGKGRILVQAADGSEQGFKKLRSITPDIRVVSVFDAAQLAGVLGRNHVIHVVLTQGGLADRIEKLVRRIEGIDGVNPA